ncbi:MAG: glycerol-3-phosphate 1-O-acyltransferase PlsY [Fusobacteriaceae bacterium]
MAEILKLFLFAIAVVIAYIFGSIPSGVWIGKKFCGKDIREHGSKNSGATNAYRVLGPKYGIIVMAADAFKGWAALLIANKILRVNGTLIVIVALVVILGHTFSLFLKFKGGKGVATSLGVFIYLFPMGIFLAAIVFGVTVYFTKYISLASIISSVFLFIISFVVPATSNVPKYMMIILTLIVAAFIIYKHRANIERLRSGTENKFGTKK